MRSDDTEKKTRRAADDLLEPSRDGGRRKIPWNRLDLSALTPAQRDVIGSAWRERMRQEHLAVGAFSLIAQELAEQGCDPVVLALITRASSDEVRQSCSVLHEVHLVCRLLIHPRLAKPSP